MKISEIITDKYKLRIEPNVYYDLLADVREAEEEQEPCEDCISRREAISIASIATLSVNQVVTALEKLPPVNPQKPICPSAGVDCEDCPAYEKKPNKWIPFSVDTMPKEGMDCLITIKGKDGICTTEKSKLFDFTYWQGFGRDIEVTAWMPLPEPYKADKEEKSKECCYNKDDECQLGYGKCSSISKCFTFE